MGWRGSGQIGVAGVGHNFMLGVVSWLVFLGGIYLHQMEELTQHAQSLTPTLKLSAGKASCIPTVFGGSDIKSMWQANNIKIAFSYGYIHIFVISSRGRTEHFRTQRMTRLQWVRRPGTTL